MPDTPSSAVRVIKRLEEYEFSVSLHTVRDPFDDADIFVVLGFSGNAHVLASWRQVDGKPAQSLGVVVSAEGKSGGIPSNALDAWLRTWSKL
jgi:hypothetical protein